MMHALIVLSAAVARAQTPTARPNHNADPETVPLWETGALGNADTEGPTLTIFREASRPNGGTSVIVAPGPICAVASKQLSCKLQSHAIGNTPLGCCYRRG